jgi:hypothetical protein
MSISTCIFTNHETKERKTRKGDCLGPIYPANWTREGRLGRDDCNGGRKKCIRGRKVGGTSMTDEDEDSILPGGSWHGQEVSEA